MTLPGNTFSTYLKTHALPVAERTLFFNNALLDGSIFEVIRGPSIPAGQYVNVMIDYAVSTNVAAYTIGDPAPVAGTTSSVLAQFNKDFFQESIKTYDLYEKWAAGGMGNHAGLTDMFDKALMQGVDNLRNLASTTMLADIVTWIDAANNFSDAALARGTYTSLVSYEETSVSTLDITSMEDAAEAMENTTYGPVARTDMAWLMARNQLSNLSRAMGPAAYNATFSTTAVNLDTSGNVDPSAVHRVGTCCGIPVYIVPGLSTTDILLVNKSKIKVFEWSPLDIKPLYPDAAENSALLTYGACIVVLDPRQQAKLSGVTA